MTFSTFHLSFCILLLYWCGISDICSIHDNGWVLIDVTNQVYGVKHICSHFVLEKFSASWETFQQGHSKHSHTVQICNNLSWCFSSSRLKNIQARILPKRFDNILMFACAITWIILNTLNCTKMFILVISAMQINLWLLNFMRHQMAHNFINVYIVVFIIHTTLLYSIHCRCSA